MESTAMYNFWSKDWSKLIRVKWNKNKPMPKSIKNKIRKELGAGFLYELSVSQEDNAEYTII